MSAKDIEVPTGRKSGRVVVVAIIVGLALLGALVATMVLRPKPQGASSSTGESVETAAPDEVTNLEIPIDDAGEGPGDEVASGQRTAAEAPQLPSDVVQTGPAVDDAAQRSSDVETPEIPLS